MKNTFDLRNFLIENKLTQNSKLLKEALTVVGHTPEEQKKNAEELVAAAEKAGRDAKIEYREDGSIFGVNIGAPGLGTPKEVRDVQDRQFAEYDKNKPKDDKPSFKPQKLKKLKLGGKTYEIGDFDPNDDGRIESIEKYPNGYYITGGVYSDYGNGDGPKEGYGYAIDLKGNEMDEEDLEGLHEEIHEGYADIESIRNAVQGKEADAIFNAAQELLDSGDADTMVDALNIAADQYYELYDRKGNEDGVEVAKYIMNSLPKPKKSNVQDFSKLKNYDDLDKSKIAVSRGTLSKDS